MMATEGNDLLLSDSVVDEPVEKGTPTELYRDSLISDLTNQQPSHIKLRTGLTRDQFTGLINTYLWLNSQGKLVSSGYVKGRNQDFANYLEPAVVSGYFTCPKYLVMSDEVKGRFTLSQDYPFDESKVMTAIEFSDTWDQLLRAINPKNLQLQMVPVKVAVSDTLDSGYPKVFHSKVNAFDDEEAIRLPVILKDNVNIYSLRYWVVNVQEYFEVLVHNWFHALVHPTTGPEASHVTSKPVVSKTNDLKAKDEK